MPAKCSHPTGRPCARATSTGHALKCYLTTLLSHIHVSFVMYLRYTSQVLRQWFVMFLQRVVCAYGILLCSAYSVGHALQVSTLKATQEYDKSWKNTSSLQEIALEASRRLISGGNVNIPPGSRGGSVGQPEALEGDQPPAPRPVSLSSGLVRAQVPQGTISIWYLGWA